MNFKLNESDIIINDLFVITSDVSQDTTLLKLAKLIWPDMHYQSQGMTLIDYPGEYELNGYTIEVISDSEWTLNYVIATGEDHIWYVQNSKLVTNRIFADVTDWVCDRDDVIAAIEKLDESGKIHDVRQN
jgi:hypothetical protein